MASWENCQKYEQERAQKIAQERAQHMRDTWQKHGLLPYLDIAFDLTNCDDPKFPSISDLHDNRVYLWIDSVGDIPNFVKTKKDQLEAKRPRFSTQQLVCC